MVRSQDKLASNLYDTSEIKCDKCDDDMELVNISNIALPECERCITKKSKGLDKRVLKRALTTLAGYWVCYEKVCLIIREGAY